jgi:hypothetical protein
MKCFHNETLFTSELVHRNLNSLGRRGRDRMVVTVMDLQLPMPSVPITTGFVVRTNLLSSVFTYEYIN